MPQSFRLLGVPISCAAKAKRADTKKQRGAVKAGRSKVTDY